MSAACYQAIYQRAHAEVLAWTPAPFPKSAAPGGAAPVERRVGPGFPDLVDRQASAPGFSPRGGRRDLSVVGFLCAVAVALAFPAWLSVSIWKGVRP